MVVTTNILKQKYSDYSNPLDKIKREADAGRLIRLTRGIYETDKNVDSPFLACIIMPLSYLSFDWALSYYGLIPERVEAITSASFGLRKKKTFINKFCRYEYQDVPSSVYPNGLTLIQNGTYIAKIATKEKAICDSLSKWRIVQNIKDLKELLFLDKRINEEDFSSLDFDNILKLAPLYRRTNLDLLTRLIRKEYKHE